VADVNQPEPPWTIKYFELAVFLQGLWNTKEILIRTWFIALYLFRMSCLYANAILLHENSSGTSELSFSLKIIDLAP
jgi:hypothetical protein